MLKVNVTFVIDIIERSGVFALNPTYSTGIPAVSGDEVYSIGKIRPRGRNFC